MRILAGKFKYKRINYKKDDKLRPTRNVVRKSFFDTVAPMVRESVFLDLFAGSGTMGLEALSRGAKRAIFVDRAKRSIDIIKRNVSESGCEGSALVIKDDAYNFAKSDLLKSVDLVYVDAPYEFEIEIFLDEFFKYVNPLAVVCVEHERSRIMPDRFGRFVKFKVRNFGKSTLSYFGVPEDE